MAYTQEYVNQLVREAAQQAGGTLSYEDVTRAAANMGIPVSQINAAVSTGVITGFPEPEVVSAPVAMPAIYDQDYVNQLVQEAAAQAGGTLSYADAARAAANLGIPVSMLNAATSIGAITDIPATVARPPAVKPPVAPPPAATPTMPQGYDQNYVNQLLREAAQQAGGGLSYADAVNAARNLGVPINMVDTAMPFANATQGIQQNFQNYMGIPIGAQYNPGVTPGGVSPYSMVMSQMPQGVQNPYANFIAGSSMGGYDPNVYNTLLRQVDQEVLRNAVDENLMSGGGDDGVGGGDAGAGGGFSGMSNSGEGGPDGIGGWAMGGLIDRVGGPNPPGKDDGLGMLQLGEYVVKKSAVDKYGKGLLDMINAGKVPAKKIKSLLD